MNIPIYDFEKEIPGLADKIVASRTVAYHAPLQPYDIELITRDFSVANNISLASKQEDLFYVKSILVTTCWNLNDDVFTKQPVWAARHTPKDKPTNLNHEESKIIGHMIGSWPIDDNGDLIPDDTPLDELPDKFHLLASSVIYTIWADEEIKASVDDLISSIAAGNKCVSMECEFNNFDYALKMPNGDFRILPRNQSTAFLTKHLRAYGGKGQYNDVKIGRLLKNITFSGKGFVDNPANPESVIFNDDSVFDFANAKILENNPFCENSGVLSYADITANKTTNKQENNNMSEILEQQIKELKDQVASANKVNEELREKLSKADTEKYTQEITVLKSDVEALTKANTELQTKLEEVEGTLASTKSDFEKVSQELEEANKAKAEIEKAAKETARVSELVAAGMPEEEAKATVAQFTNLVDEQYSVVSKLAIAAFKKSKEEDKSEDKEEDKDKKKEKAEASTEDAETDPNEDNAEANLQDVEQTEETPDLTASASTEDNSFNDLVHAIAGLLNKKVESK